MENPRENMVAQRSRQRRLGQHLRQLYDEVVSEEIPDDFLKLLEEADQKAKKSTQSDSDASSGDSE
ncbi:NepR family anti-sigma factor [Ponticaulis sp.]|uniref:NepR family anti-sigma factor n=1 Tax=Ponticaulis sp. TaxID=2020902 RepID=UPI000B6CE400|nr:NepR family anti-sigma factor [Ponticaulis sp.]MAI88979.1 hypothetical protein [Ponticaulis sp.]OUY01664.1 MAG: hypothetical protein CBB65_00670 [Hyphomonadaceae bacterium TMED5]|tara:strand:- start:96744 stop:96941 length:198 start_codon:yes stop_codon:yes gene_type:complete